jgi:hypothetical protein
MANYELSGSTLKPTELYLYGSSRMSVFRPDFTVFPVSGSGISTNYLGKNNAN